MSLFAIDTVTCTSCGICADECPVGRIIVMDKESKLPKPADNAEAMCISCGHCVSVCPTGAFSLRGMPAEACQTIDRALFPASDNLAHLMRSRRSIRRFTDKTVDRDIIAGIIDTARFAPSGHNLQNVDWIVVHDREKVTNLSKITIDWMKQLLKDNHPAAEAYGVKHLIAAWRAGIDPICRNAPHVVVIHAPKQKGSSMFDSMIAMSWFELLAASKGLGTCAAGYVMACSAYWPPVAEELALPEGNVLYGALLLGYPKYDYHRIPARKIKEIVWR